MHHDPTPSPFQRTATLPHNYTMGTLPHPHNHPRSVSYDHSNGPAASRPGYVTLPRRPRASVAGYGRDAAPSPAFSYGGPVTEHRDPIYDGVGPRTSADGSSKLSLNQSQGDGTPRGHSSTGGRPPGSISYALPPPIDEAPEIRPKPKQDNDGMSTATSQMTLGELEENLAAYDEPWGKALPPCADGPESSHSNSTLEDTAKLNPNPREHEDPVMCSTPKSLGGEELIRDLPHPPSSVIPPKTKPKTWKKPPSVPPKPLSPTDEYPGDGSQQPLLADSSQQPLLPGPDHTQQLSVHTTYSPNISSAEASPRTQQLLSPNDSVTSSQLSADHSPRGGTGFPPSDNVPIWTHAQQQQRKVGKIRPQPPPKPKMSLNSGPNAQQQQPKHSESTTNSFQDETNDGSEV